MRICKDQGSPHPRTSFLSVENMHEAVSFVGFPALINFYIEHFFEEDGCPKYYHDRKYPIDIHCPGQLFVTLHRLRKFDAYRTMAEQVLNWTIENMQDRKGYFYYQLRSGISSRISYMRWSNAFMFNALSCYSLNIK